MRLKTLVTVGLLTFCCDAWGQDSLNSQKQPFLIRGLSSKSKTEPPLFVIKSDSKTCQVPKSGRFSNYRKVKRAFKKFKTDWVQSITVIKGKEATEKYGVLGQFGVIVIYVKDETYEVLPRRLKRGCK